MAVTATEPVLGERFRRRTLVLSGVIFVLIAALLFAPRPEGFADLVDVSALPWVNAGINGVAFLLLLVGYAAVRTRRMRLHRLAMTSAMATSAVFLVSYVTYHLFSAGPARYEGSYRAVYLVLLLTHVVLAALILPAAMNTWARGWTGATTSHRRIARPTLAAWMYVSVTGILVTWMAHG